MTEEKTLEEIKADMLARGWVWTTFPRVGFDEGWDCQVSDLTIETAEILYFGPMTIRWGGTKEEAIRAAYARALEYFPTLPTRYDEQGIPYRIIGGAS